MRCLVRCLALPPDFGRAVCLGWWRRRRRSAGPAPATPAGNPRAGRAGSRRVSAENRVTSCDSENSWMTPPSRSRRSTRMPPERGCVPHAGGRWSPVSTAIPPTSCRPRRHRASTARPVLPRRFRPNRRCRSVPSRRRGDRRCRLVQHDRHRRPQDPASDVVGIDHALRGSPNATVDS